MVITSLLVVMQSNPCAKPLIKRPSSPAGLHSMGIGEAILNAATRSPGQCVPDSWKEFRFSRKTTPRGGVGIRQVRRIRCYRRIDRRMAPARLMLMLRGLWGALLSVHQVLTTGVLWRIG